MGAFDFTPEQSRAISDRGGALLVSAGAGSGKTRVLVERLLSRVAEGADIDSFLIITYTKAAAAELRGRILEELSRLLAQEPKNRHLRRQTTLVYRAKISTVHAFCSSVIRQNAHLLGISPDTRAADENESALLKNDVLDELLEKYYDNISNDPGFAALADASSAGRNDLKLCRIVLDLHSALQSHGSPEKWLARALEAYSTGSSDPYDTPWGRLLLDRAREKTAYHLARISEALSLIYKDEKLEKAYADSFEATLEGLASLSKALPLGFAAASGVAVDFPKLKPVRGCEDPALQERVKGIRQLCKDDISEITELVRDPQSLMDDLRAIRPQVEALFRLVSDFDKAYSKEKRRRSLMDFSDQEHMALRLLAPEGEPTELAHSLSERFSEVCVDEYQDSSRVQEQIFLAVSDGGKKLFMVGDVKQSIYRFRLADPTLFLEKYLSYKDAEEASPGEARRVNLSKNFRSSPALLDAVNYVFYNIMSTESGEMDYTPREFLYPGLPEDGSDTGPAVEFTVLDVQADEDEEESPDRAVLEAAFIARRALELRRDGFSYGDMVVLMRSPGSRMAAFSKAFSLYGVPLASERSGGFWASVEVRVVMSVLAIVDNPQQDVALISAMRSPVFGFSPDELARIRLKNKSSDFYTALCLAADEDERCKSFLSRLEALRDISADLPSDELLRLIYEQTAMPAVFGAMPEGAARRRNLMILFDYARSFEAAGYKGLFSFLNHLNAMADRGAEPQGAAPEDGGGAVRVMSIHKSKGLEFPVVFLADTAHRFNTDDLKKPVLIHPDLGVGPKRTDTALGAEFTTLPRLAIAEKLRDEQLAEEMRLLYVAMTRAKKKLVITAAPRGCENAVKRLCAGITMPPSPFRVREASSMSDWLIPVAAARPEGGALRELAGDMATAESAGKPWLIRLASLSPADVSPSPDAEEEPAADTADAAMDAEPVFTDGLDHVYPHSAAVPLPSKLTATGLKGRFADFEAASGAPAPKKKNEFHRPVFLDERPLSPTERGTALHLAMQFIDFSACTTPGGVERELERLSAMGFLSSAQRSAVQPEKIEAFFSSPLGQELLGSGSVTREFKFSVLVDAADYFPEAEGEHILLQGVVDCAFVEDDRLTIIDFKTDYVTKSTQNQRAEGYKAQLETYAKALTHIMNIPVRRKILYFFATGEAVEV